MQHRRTEFEQMGFQVAFESENVIAQLNVSRADQQKVVYGLSNSAIFSDLEQSLTQF